MLRRTFLPALIAALVATVAFILVQPAGPAGSAAAAPVRIMPLGDSITAGPGCWRAKLWHRLQTSGYTNIDFVGGVSDGGGCNPGYAYDFDHEGHGGYSATGIADNNQLPPWLTAARPDVILMHLGTNDMWGGYIPLATKLAAFTKLVGQMRADNPAVKIIVAQIIPMSQAACATCPADVVALNNAIPGWAAGLTTAQSPITVADLWTGFDAVADTGDGVHPNDAGFQKMADAWYPAVTRVLSGVTPSASPSASASPSRSASPSVSASPSRSASPSASASSGGSQCAATYRVISQWGGAFQGEVTVTNTSATTSSAWTTTFTFANGQQVSQAWNTTLTQSSATVTARNVSYNGALSPAASTSFGFLASWNNTTNATPTVTCRLS
ncbi:cellulose binding domain-containing protein [Dactylosporangium sp. AC04546]|uniref:cellulose binding domain-containing protein n=1 Tax=Dactylosporangium sp. AC04546 TaxID=2862460 RepID=UPI001EDFC35C|nr:cellulose binding domain-containing protein [Dactylosporangium sp. AC04546]WVK84859.1 cellulose binding domain-containing protein [Dactylosporangium sp. AC04546]